MAVTIANGSVALPQNSVYRCVELALAFWFSYITLLRRDRAEDRVV
jgi:hypothetical protein